MKQRLAEWRIAQGLSQGQLARQIGCAQSQIGRWELGVSEPCAEHRAALAKAGYTGGNWMIRVEMDTAEAAELYATLSGQVLKGAVLELVRKLGKELDRGSHE